MAKIALFEVNEKDKLHIKARLKNNKLTFFDKPLKIQNLKDIKDIDILVVFTFSQVNKMVINRLPKLKFIATMSTGFDHIDLKECKAKGIKVSNVPNYGERTVAEHTFALMLAIEKNILKSVEHTRKGDFRLEGLMGRDLDGKTIGLLGCGHIGINVAKIARGFNMKVIVYDLIKDQKLAKKTGFEYTSMDNVLKNSDFISIHVPYNKHTHHLINKNNVKKIKKGAILINTSRGGLIDTDALIYALDRGIVAGAGLDVLEDECYILEEKQLLSKELRKSCDLRTVLANNILLERDNVIVTPHSAFYTKEALLRIINTMLDNIVSFTKGKLINEVKC
jgi:D-lactate dehydrogenase